MDRIDELNHSILELRDRLVQHKRRLADDIAAERGVRAELSCVAEELRTAEGGPSRDALLERSRGLEVALRERTARLGEARAALRRLGDELEDARQRRNQHIAALKRRPH